MYKRQRVYTVEYLGNVIEGNPIRYLNVEIDILKRATIESIKNNDPVWFGCDVSKYLHRTHGVMDTKLFDFELFYGTSFPLDKASRLEYGESKMTHAMLFTGVDLDLNGNPKNGGLRIVGKKEMARRDITLCLTIGLSSICMRW